MSTSPHHAPINMIKGNKNDKKGKFSFGIITIFFFIFCLWCVLLYSVFNPSSNKSLDNNNNNNNNNQPETIVIEEKSEIIHGNIRGNSNDISIKEIKLPKRYHQPENPIQEQPTLKEVEQNMTLYLRTLHSRLGDIAGPTVDAELAWETFFDVTRSLPMKWDEENRYRFPTPRKDGSIFVSLGTYRDPFCPMTIKSLYDQAENPDKLFIGLFQQNCFGPKCRTGVLVGGKVEDAGPDVNCYIEFCKSPEGQRSNACNNGNVRLFNVNESESLGPYMARYLGSKFYRGEQYYLQIDSHSEFTKHWDSKLIKMIHDAPALKPVISTYPPDSTMNWRDSIGYRICDSMFATALIEWQIIRLGTGMRFDSTQSKVPLYAPFVAAGFYFAPATVLQDVPFDPLLPWIFMGEEISMSSRLWTSGYDIFSPTINVLNHYYVRRHYPKFWESVNRNFKKPIHNNILELMIKRVKSMLEYPESQADRVFPSSLLYKLEEYSMGNKRSFSDYLNMVGIEPKTKTITTNNWCHRGEWPELANKYKVSPNKKLEDL
jgi:hypothetical protein